MKVYVVIVTSGVWCDFLNFEVFSNKESAEEYIAEHKQNTIGDDDECFLYERVVR